MRGRPPAAQLATVSQHSPLGVEMAPSAGRSKPISSPTLSELFPLVGGYYEMGNDELAGALLQWDLLEETSRRNEVTAWSYLKWSFTTSFLELLNALQWFASGILLERSSYFPAQTMQQYYYSIFFSYGSFLAIHGKGHYTVKIGLDDAKETTTTRQELWFDEGPPPFIETKQKGQGGEHEIRADWFYEVFRNWDHRESHPAVQLFEDDRRFHTGFRNMFTYSLAELAQELQHTATGEPASNEIMLRLWHHDPDLVEYFPEEFWVLSHFRAPFDLHCKLIEEFENGSPFTSVQEYMLTTLLSRHENDGLAGLLREILRPMLARLQGGDAGYR